MEIKERTEKPKIVDILIRQRNAKFLSNLYFILFGSENEKVDVLFEFVSFLE